MRVFILKKIFFVALIFFIPFVSLAAIEQPSCDSLKSWVETYDEKQTFEPRPGMQLNIIFKDENFTPVFNKPILEWERNDIKQLQGWLARCRKQAYSNKDKASGVQFYTVMKAVKLASRSLRSIWAEQRAVYKQKKHEQIAKDRALQRENVQQKNASAMMEKKQSVSASRLKNRQTPEQHQLLLDQINSIPETSSGLVQLNRIAYKTDIGLMSQEQKESYDQAFQKKRRIINAKMAEQEAKAKTEALKPMDLTERFSWLFQGDEVEDLTIRGLRPGMSKKETIVKLRNDWAFESGGTTLDSSDFTVKRKDWAKYKKERRNGGAVTLSSMKDDEIGQLKFEEHYLAMVIPGQAQRLLTDKLGKPDKVQPGGGGIFLMWKEGDYRLQVFLTNQLEVVWKGAGYKSRLALSFWNEDFEDHLEQVNKRCEQIKSKARSQWSINDSTFFTMQCNLLGGQARKPGL